MQQMPDKEFDQLFKDHFADAEMEPSRDLWASIEEEITPKQKRGIPILWMAAASVAVAFTALMVFQKDETIQLQGRTSYAMADESATPTVKRVPMEATQARPAVQLQQTDSRELDQFKASLVKYDDSQFVGKKVENFSIAMQPTQPTEHLPIKRAEARPLDVMPKQEETLNNPVMYASVEATRDPSNPVIGETENIGRKGINSVGDLVNFVVDKVDKRDKKLIEFGSDDDDGTAIVGINIGFLKWNKKHKQ